MTDTRLVATRRRRGRAGATPDMPPQLPLLHGLPPRLAIVPPARDCDALVWRDRILSGTASDYVALVDDDCGVAPEAVVAHLDNRPDVGVCWIAREVGGYAPARFAEAVRYGLYIAGVVVRRALLQAVMYAGRNRGQRGNADILADCAAVTRVLRWGADEPEAVAAREQQTRILRVVGDLTRQGAQRTVRNLCLSVDRDEFATEVLAIRGGPLADELEAAGVRVTVVGGEAQLRQVFPAAAARADIVNLHYWGHEWGVLEALEKSGRLVVTSHTYGIRYYRTDAWSVVPYHIAPHEADFYAPEQIEIASGLDWNIIDAARMPRHEARVAEGLSAVEPVFLSVTKAEEVKGWRLYLDAVERVAQRVPGAAFYAIGPAEWHREWDDYQERVAELQAAGIDVRTENNVPLERVIRLMCAADVVASTSTNEATPLALREAARCRTPIVATDVGGTSQVVPHDAILLSERDAELVAAAMIGQVGQRGGELPWERWTLQAQAARYEELYRLVLQDCGQQRQPIRMPSRHVPMELERKPERGQRTFCIVCGRGGRSGGEKAIRCIAQHLQQRGWFVEIALMTGENADMWDEFSVVPWGRTRPHYDIAMATFVTTRPKAREISCGLRLGLVQSDEPEWVRGEAYYDEWRQAFELDGFRDIIIAEHMSEFAEKYGMNIVGRLTPGIDTITFSPRADMPSGRLGEQAPRLFVITKSVPTWYGGHEYLLPALEELARRYPTLSVDWLGYPPPSLPCPVRHHQTYDEHEVAQLYSQATVFVLPSIIEGSPRTVREAMACGTPVVTTPTGVEDYATHGRDVMFVPPRDSNAIVEAVGYLLDNPRERERIALSALRLIQRRTWERYLAEFDAILEREWAEIDANTMVAVE